jgi:CO/xanthine dehydrogenase FAD-binding subunit
MLDSVKEYFDPVDLTEAVALLRHFGSDAVPVGGGLDLIWRPRSHIRVLVGLDHLDLNSIQRQEDDLVLGATATIRQVIESPLVAEMWGGFLPRVLKNIATPLLRGLITIGGALVRAYPWSDIPVLLLGLEAKVILFESEDLLLPLSEFYAQRLGRTGQPYLLRNVLLPLRPGWRIAYRRFTRTAVDIPLLNQFLGLRMSPEGTVAEAAVWLGSRPGPAVRVAEAERVLVGSRLTSEDFDQATSAMRESAPVESDMRLSGDMRRHLAGVLLRRNLEEVVGHAA